MLSFVSGKHIATAVSKKDTFKIYINTAVDASTEPEIKASNQNKQVKQAKDRKPGRKIGSQGEIKASNQSKESEQASNASNRLKQSIGSQGDDHEKPGRKP